MAAPSATLHSSSRRSRATSRESDESCGPARARRRRDHDRRAPASGLGTCRPRGRAAVDRALELLEQAGARLRDVDLPDLARAETVMWVITSADAAEYHRTLLRNHATSCIHSSPSCSGEARPSRHRLRPRPTGPSTPDRRAARSLRASTSSSCRPRRSPPSGRVGYRHDRRPRGARATCDEPIPPLFDLTGGPALSLPCGLDSRGMPIGLQVAGPAFADDVLRVACAYERDACWTMLRRSARAAAT